MILRIACVCSVLLLCLAGWMNQDEFAQGDTTGIRIYGANVNTSPKPAPVDIPEIRTGDEQNWELLCSQCHIGPDFNSNTHLTWSHNHACQVQTTCFDCHGNNLHDHGVRGSKRVCMECHITSGLSFSCSYCHYDGWAEIHTPVDHTLATHSDIATDTNLNCNTCHGTESWCNDCHGVEMPHPDDMLKTHSTLVRGKPESCVKCHGARACEQCHISREVERLTYRHSNNGKLK